MPLPQVWRWATISSLSIPGVPTRSSLYLFGRYEYYDSMYKTAKAVTHYEEYGRQRLAVGVNYYPLKEVVLKGEYSIGLLKSKFNNEPAVSVGVAYAGFFNL